MKVLFVLDTPTKKSAVAHSIDTNNCKIDGSTALFIPNLLSSWSTFETSLQKFCKKFDMFHRNINIQHGPWTALFRIHIDVFYFTQDLPDAMWMFPDPMHVCYHFITVAEHFQIVHVPYYSKVFGRLFLKSPLYSPRLLLFDQKYRKTNTVKCLTI